jgi:hypothetical protein
MRAHVIENGKIVNTIEVDLLDFFPDLHLIDADLHGGKIGDDYAEEAGEVISVTPPRIVPEQVSMRQARQALLMATNSDGVSLLSQVQVLIDAIADPMDREWMQIEWDRSQVVTRNRPSVVQIGTGLGLTAAQLDDMFVYAATLP